MFDGDGLRLRIKPNCSKPWIFNYYKPITGKRANLISLGRYPDLSLANARKNAMAARELLAQRIDPQEELVHKEIYEHTFAKVSEDWFNLKKHEVTPDYAVDIWRSLELHVFPQIANTPVKDIDAPLVITYRSKKQPRGG